MNKCPVPVEGTLNYHYKYILVVLDIFSRFLFLRPLRSKSSSEIASVLLQIFSDIGPPLHIHSDQGTEFKGVVYTLTPSLGVQIIHSSYTIPSSITRKSKFITSVKVVTVITVKVKMMYIIMYYQECIRESTQQHTQSIATCCAQTTSLYSSCMNIISLEC